MSTILIDLENTLLSRSLSIKSFAKSLLTGFDRELGSNSLAHLEWVIANSEQDGYRAQQAPFTTAREAIANGLAANLDWNKPVPIEHLETYWSEHFPLHAHPMPGAKELLLTLKNENHTVAILSNGYHRSRVTMLDRLGFTPLIQELFSSEALGASKPNSLAFKLAIAHLGSTCETSYHVGDHPFNDILGAQRVGLTPIWLEGCHPWPTHIPTPTFKITHLPEVMNVIEHNNKPLPIRYDDTRLSPSPGGHQFV